MLRLFVGLPILHDTHTKYKQISMYFDVDVVLGTEHVQEMP